MFWFEMLVMVLIVLVIVWISNFVLGVLVGVIVVMILFVCCIVYVIYVECILSDDGKSVCYIVYGFLFFVSSNDLFEYFDYVYDFK